MGYHEIFLLFAIGVIRFESLNFGTDQVFPFDLLHVADL